VAGAEGTWRPARASRRRRRASTVTTRSPSRSRSRPPSARYPALRGRRRRSDFAGASRPRAVGLVDPGGRSPASASRLSATLDNLEAVDHHRPSDYLRKRRHRLGSAGRPRRGGRSRTRSAWAGCSATVRSRALVDLPAPDRSDEDSRRWTFSRLCSCTPCSSARSSTTFFVLADDQPQAWSTATPTPRPSPTPRPPAGARPGLQGRARPATGFCRMAYELVERGKGSFATSRASTSSSPGTSSRGDDDVRQRPRALLEAGPVRRAAHELGDLTFVLGSLPAAGLVVARGAGDRLAGVEREGRCRLRPACRDAQVRPDGRLLRRL